jgi:hypothetical protein
MILKSLVFFDQEFKTAATFARADGYEQVSTVSAVIIGNRAQPRKLV